jgi:hypothetical protein
MRDLSATVNSAKTLVGLTDQDIATLKGVSETTTTWAPELAKAFYDLLYEYVPTAALLSEQSDRETRERGLIEWYKYVIGCEHRSTFWHETWLIGLVHIVANIDNVFMYGMASRVEQIFLDKCVQSFPNDQAVDVYKSFKRVMSMIAILIADGYLKGLIEGMEKVGLNDRLLSRMRAVTVRRSIAQMREQIEAENAEQSA